MAEKKGNPQVEDGHARIANELIDALCRTHLSPTEGKVIWMVIRRTYSWQRKTDRITYGQVAKGCAINRSSAVRAICRLVERHILNRKDGYIGINKHYAHWTDEVGAELSLGAESSLGAELSLGAESSLPSLQEGGVKTEPTPSVKTEPTPSVKTEPTPRSEVGAELIPHIKKGIKQSSKETTKERANGSDGFNIFQWYERNFGLLTQPICETLRVWEEEYTEDILEAALREDTQCVRTLPYIRVIVERLKKTQQAQLEQRLDPKNLSFPGAMDISEARRKAEAEKEAARQRFAKHE